MSLHHPDNKQERTPREILDDIRRELDTWEEDLDYEPETGWRDWPVFRLFGRGRRLEAKLEGNFAEW